MKGLQDGFDWRKTLWTLVFVLLSVGAVSSGVIDGPDPWASVNLKEFTVQIIGDAPDPIGEAMSNGSCSIPDIDSCWQSCEEYGASQYGDSYTVKRVDCRATGISGQPACTCTFHIPGPYYQPIYWAGPKDFGF